MWLSLLTNKFVIIGIIVAVLGAYIFVLRNNVTTLEAEKRALALELKVSQESVKSLQAAIDEQNKAIEKMKEDAIAREREGAAIIAKAQVEAQTAKKRAADILKMRPQTANNCEAANDLFNKVIKNGK